MRSRIIRFVLKCPKLIFNISGLGGGTITRNNLFKVLGLLAVFIIAGIPPASASSVGAHNVVVTSQYVMATAKHSCSDATDYKYHTKVFYNYNPAKHTWGTLRFQEGKYYGHNKGTSPEGLWYDVKTDMDWCLISGKSHDRRGVYLVPYNGVINGKKVVNGNFV